MHWRAGGVRTALLRSRAGLLGVQLAARQQMLSASVTLSDTVDWLVPILGCLHAHQGISCSPYVALGRPKVLGAQIPPVRPPERPAPVRTRVVPWPGGSMHSSTDSEPLRRVVMLPPAASHGRHGSVAGAQSGRVRGRKRVIRTGPARFALVHRDRPPAGGRCPLPGEARIHEAAAGACIRIGYGCSCRR